MVREFCQKIIPALVNPWFVKKYGKEDYPLDDSLNDE